MPLISFREFILENKENKIKKLVNMLYKKYDIKELIITDVSRSGMKMLRLSIINIDSKESGIGSKVMKEITDFLDKEGYFMVLNPSDDYGSDVSRLEKFYERFGFLKNSGATKMPGIFEKMFRIPNFG